jgi:hypothetical protein
MLLIHRVLIFPRCVYFLGKTVKKSKNQFYESDDDFSVSHTPYTHCCYIVRTVLSHCCHIVVTLLPHCCNTVVTLLYCCYTVVTLLFHCCHIVVILLLRLLHS